MSFEHDKYAKQVFCDPSRAREELEQAVGPAVSALIDWSTLTPEPTELADQLLAPRFADLRFQARLLGRELLLDLIFEHQSEADPEMPVRFFCHTGALWNMIRNQKEREGKKVPLVINVLLHNGREPWTLPLTLASVIAGGELFEEHAPHLLPTLPILIDDLAGQTDEQIRARPQSPDVRLALLLMKHVPLGNGVRVIQRERELVQRASPEAVEDGVSYLLKADRGASRQELREAMQSHRGKEGRDMLETIGDRLKAEGRQEGLTKGRAEGRQEGLAEGKAEGRAEAILLFLRHRGLDVPTDVRDYILACTDQDRLARWIGLAVTAPSARDVIAE
jgi:hypothetical protein